MDPQIPAEIIKQLQDISKNTELSLEQGTKLTDLVMPVEGALLKLEQLWNLQAQCLMSQDKTNKLLTEILDVLKTQKVV